ncbi:MAG: flagellar filament capping protein FliD [Polyangiaceae bacterium]|nr:flagellar filament capping protein FliD [Polyangiaceae bacterium]
MSSITFGGLASGLDTNAIIDGLMKAERIPLDRITSRQSEVQAAKDGISSMSTKMANLKSAAQALSSLSGFSSYKAGSTDSSIVASVSGASSPASYTVSVQKLAREQRSYATPQASSTSALGMSGSLGITVGSGSPVSISIASTDTLTDIATKIGSSGARLSASVVYDGSQYRLQVRGLDSGAANAITFDEQGFSLGLTGTPTQKAQDAELTIDGIPMTRSTNQVGGAIPGTTLALTKENVTSEVSITSDGDALKKKVAAFVTAYNDIVNTGHTLAGFGTTKASVKELSGDSSIRSSLDKISRLVSQTVPGTTGKYTTLGSIGLGTDRDGKLKLDEAKLTAALTADPNAVTKLFVNDSNIGATGAMKAFMTAVDQIATNEKSTLKARGDALGKLSQRLDDDYAALDRRMAQIETQYRQRFSALETTVSKYNQQGAAITNMSSSGGNK